MNNANAPALTLPVTPTGDQRVDGLLGPARWAGPVAWSDPASPADYEPGHQEAFSDFARLGPRQFATVAAALTGTGPADRGFSVAGFTNLEIAYAGSGGAAEIRLANTSDPTTAYTYSLSEAPEGGDVFFGASGDAPDPGDYDHLTVLHELGHALGLKHGHQPGSFGPLPPEEDSMEFSLMTYRSHVGADPGTLHNETWSHAQTYMVDDIAALQALYGADFTTGAGDTTYSWDPLTGVTRVDGAPAIVPGANRVFLTVWDGGGTDTYDLSAYGTALDLDLAPGGHSTLAAGQLAWLAGGPEADVARGNVFNARLFHGDPRSWIENAVGGSGGDRIFGNGADNGLDGRAGDDRLCGRGGDDRLAGNSGSDRLLGGSGADRLDGGAGADVLIGGAGADVFCFAAPGQSRPRAPDVLRKGGGAPAFDAAGPGEGDLLDLSGIDADPLRQGAQDFRFGDSHGGGRLWLLERHGDTVVRASAGSGGEFKLVIEDGAVRASAYSADDFLGVA